MSHSEDPTHISVERLVGEMLAAGIIQPSMSPYLNQVILVKKKMGADDFV